MRYTIQKGVERQFSERVKTNSRFILPLLVILAGVLFFSLNPYHSNKSPSKPLTLGIYTVKTPGGGSDLSGGTGGSNLNPQLAAASPIFTAPAPNTSGTTGGGSGLPVGGSGGGGSTIQPTSPPTSTGSVVCTDLLTLSQVCTICTPALLLQPGQKALLYTDGTCTAIN
jgi:hypothetical protein